MIMDTGNQNLRYTTEFVKLGHIKKRPTSAALRHAHVSKQTFTQIKSPGYDFFQQGFELLKEKYSQLCLFSHRSGITTIDIGSRYATA